MGFNVNSKPTLVDLRRVGEYATLFRWNLSFPVSGLPRVFGGTGEIGLTTIPTNPRAGDITASIANAGGESFFKKLNVLCESAATPSKTVGKIPVNLRGHTYFQPGIVSLATDGIKFNFIENVENVIHHFFYAWQEAIWAMNVGVGVPYDSLVADRIVLTRLDNADRPICNYHLRFCFLRGYDPGGLSGDDNGAMNASVVLTYDDFFVTGTNLESIYASDQLYRSTI